MITHKICSICKLLLSIDSFGKRKRAKDGLQSECKSCCTKYAKKYYIKNKNELSEAHKVYYEENKQEIKENSRDYYKNNKADILERAKQYKEEHKDEISVQNKIYAINNKEYISMYHREYYETNKPILRKKQNEREAFRMKEDPSFRIRKILSVNIRAGLKNNSSSKQGKSVLQYLSYPIKQLKQHLESQFESWMNWDNHGTYDSFSWDDNDSSTQTWQIDHIIPQSDLPYTSMEDDNFKKCWDLNNLRPYSSKQNILDGIKRIRHKTA